MNSKLANKIRKLSCVEELYEDSDGVWANLKAGYTHYGASAVREDTLTKLWSSLQNVFVDTDFTE